MAEGIVCSRCSDNMDSASKFPSCSEILSMLKGGYKMYVTEFADGSSYLMVEGTGSYLPAMQMYKWNPKHCCG